MIANIGKEHKSTRSDVQAEGVVVDIMIEANRAQILDAHGCHGRMCCSFGEIVFALGTEKISESV